jgi:hypothetical protein
MIAVNENPTAAVSALAFGFALATLASPSFAQRSEQQPHMSAAREKALHECSVEAEKYKTGTWLSTQLHTYRTCMMQHGEPE